MTELRDARLRQALEAAPDASARPGQDVARRIQAAARQAVAPLVPKEPAPHAAPWWQRLWQASGHPHAPWGAALASVLLAVLVTALWERAPIPDAQVPMSANGPDVPLQKKSAAPAPSTADAPVDDARLPTPKEERRAATTVPAPAPAPAAKAPPPQDAPAPAAAGAPAPAAQPAAPAMADLAPTRNKMAATSVDAEAAASRESLSSQAATGESAKGAMAGNAPAPASALSKALPADAAMAGWHGVALSIGGRSAKLDRAPSQPLLAQLRTLLQRPVVAPAHPLATEPSMQMDVQGADGRALGRLSLWDDRYRWQRSGEPERLSALSSADAQALLQLARQALESAHPTDVPTPATSAPGAPAR